MVSTGDDDPIMRGFKRVKGKLAAAQHEFPGHGPAIVALANVMVKEAEREGKHLDWSGCFDYLCDLRDRKPETVSWMIEQVES